MYFLPNYIFLEFYKDQISRAEPTDFCIGAKDLRRLEVIAWKVDSNKALQSWLLLWILSEIFKGILEDDQIMESD